MRSRGGEKESQRPPALKRSNLITRITRRAPFAPYGGWASLDPRPPDKQHQNRSKASAWIVARDGQGHRPVGLGGALRVYKGDLPPTIVSSFLFLLRASARSAGHPCSLNRLLLAPCGLNRLLSAPCGLNRLPLEALRLEQTPLGALRLEQTPPGGLAA
ncbi:hypothetical protein PG999_004593 [Apiospora kogelbergensis]|uniref:Uncharacterized protein n=1 Tax=Apiospora kogelbergensis TaxID=1337665 RepID=A0AAW0QZT3_9PEZI